LTSFNKLGLATALIIFMVLPAWADSLSVSCNRAISQEWQDYTYGCVDDENYAIYSVGTGSESDALYWDFNSGSISSSDIIDSLVPSIKGYDANGSTLHVYMAAYDDPGSYQAAPIVMVWNGSETIRHYGGHGLWGVEVTAQNLIDGAYIFVMQPEDGVDYSSVYIYVNDFYLTVWYHTSGGNPYPGIIIKNYLEGE
jgi:glutamine cyclotransferase